MGTLGELERRVMDALWDSASPLTAIELRDSLAVRDHHGPGKELAITTILTVLSRLENKGLVARERASRPHRYRTVTARDVYTAELMHQVLGGAHDREAVLSRFVGQVSAAEAVTLQRILNDR